MLIYSGNIYLEDSFVSLKVVHIMLLSYLKLKLSNKVFDYYINWITINSFALYNLPKYFFKTARQQVILLTTLVNLDTPVLYYL